MIANPAIDLVYVALRPQDHAAWSIKALEAGKHVLCEKPLALDANEAAAMNRAAAATGKRIVEAFHDRYHPVFGYALEALRSGRLGNVRSLYAVFNHTIPVDPSDFRHAPGPGGGALYDLGCYPIHWCRSFMSEEPVVVSAETKWTSAGVDQDFVAELTFGTVPARVESCMSDGWHYHARFVIEATRGRLELVNSLLPHRGHSIIETIDGVCREFTLGGNTTFDHQLDALIAALADGEPLPTEGDDPIGNLQVMDAIRARLQQQRQVR